MVSGVFSIPFPNGVPDLRPGAKSRLDSRVPHLARFIAGPENRLTRILADTLLLPATAPTACNPIVIYGPSGCGKSLLADGLAAAWADRYKQECVLTGSADRLSRASYRAVLAGQGAGATLLVVEDLEQITRNEARQRDVAWALDQLIDAGARFVVTSRVAPAALPQLSPRLRSRLAAGLVVPLVAPKYATRLELLAAYAEACRVEFTEAAARTLARRQKTSAGHLIQAVVDLAAMVGPLDQPRVIDEPLVLNHLGQLQTSQRASMAQVVRWVARHYALSPADLKGRSRRRGVVTARAVAMYLAWKVAGHTLQQIGNYLGHRDHTTVLHGCRNIQRLLTTDAGIQHTVTDLKRLLDTPGQPSQ